MEDNVYIDDDGNEVRDMEGNFCHGLVDEHGNLIKKTPYQYPYSYDGHITWRGGENEEANKTIYSDRLYQWDWDIHEELCQKHFGDRAQWWNSRPAAKIEAFLRDWCDDPDLKLIFVMQYCNASSGYPVWRFDFKRTKKDETKGNS